MDLTQRILKEEKIILSCLRQDLSPEDRKELYAIITNNSINWSRILSIAITHKIVPLVFWNLRDFNVPSWLKKTLEQLYLFERVKNHLFLSELKMVLNLSKKAGIKLVLIKGISLLTQVYTKVKVRTFEDLDFLLPRSHLNEMDTILKSLGYIQGITKIDKNLNATIEPLTDKRLKGYLGELQHTGEYKKSTGLPLNLNFSIDLHHSLTTVFDDYSVNVEKFIERSKPLGIGGEECYLLSPEDSIITLCIHLYWHTRTIRDILYENDLKLLRFCDVRESFKYYERNQIFDWKKFSHILNSEGNNLKLPIYWSIFHTELLYNEKLIPDNIREEIIPGNFEKEKDSIADRWLFKSNNSIGHWEIDFVRRLFNENRAYEALKVLYTYLDKDLQE